MKKVVKGLIIGASILVILVGGSILGTYLIVKNTLGVDPFVTLSAVSKINNKVDENKLCDNQFNEEDKANTDKALEESKDNYDQYKKDHLFDFNLEEFKKEMKTVVEFNDKEVATIVDKYIKTIYKSKISFNNYSFNVELKQIKFSNFNNGNIDLNSIFKLNIDNILNEFNEFPLTLFKDSIPHNLYLNSTVMVNKLDGNLNYEVKDKSLYINNLNNDESSSLFTVINKFFNIGTKEDVNLFIGNTICDGLIGNKDNIGLAYTLSTTVLASDYRFDIKNNEILYIIER